MVRRDGAAIRKERISEIAKFIMGSLFKEKELSLSKTLASLQYEFGLTKEKVVEYLSVLENLDRFIIDKENDKIKKIWEDDSHE